MVDSSGDEPAYRRVARMLESRIHRSEHGYGPGWALPPADRLARELGLGTRTVAAGYRVLVNMGLVSRRTGYGAVVRAQREREVIHVPAGTGVTARMPTFAEQDRWDLEPGVPMLVVEDQAWPADRYEVRVGDAEPRAD